MADACAAEELLSAWLDDELDERERAVVTGHLEICDDCAADAEGLRMVRSQLRNLPERRVPDGVLEEVAGFRRRARAGVMVVATVGVLLIATMAVDEGGDQLPRTVDVPVDVFVADHVTHTGDGTLVLPAGR